MASGVDVNQEHKDRIAKAKAPKPATLAELDRPLGAGRAGAQRDSYRKRAPASVRYTFKPMMQDAGRGPQRRSDRGHAR